jgi:(p)ppGpp synthase/HD superfamily hydrolase
MDDVLTPSALAALMASFDAEPAPVSPDRDAGFVVLGPRFDEALLYASTAHRQQARKGGPIPYVSHLLGVSSIVLAHGGTEEQAIAGLLHDTVEDCGVNHEGVIKERFGSAVLDMVLACTDARVPAGAPKPDWWTRKAAYLRHLAELPPGHPALLVSCADKVHNAEAILADLETNGLALWGRFPGKVPEDHLWYYGRLAAFFDHALAGPAAPLAHRLRVTVDALGELHRSHTEEQRALRGEDEP